MNVVQKLTLKTLGLIITSALAISSISSVIAGEKSLGQYWAEVGLTADFLKDPINSNECNSHPSIFIACIQALNTIGGYAKPPVALVSSVEASDIIYGKSLKTIGVLGLVELNPEGHEPAEDEDHFTIWQKIKERRERQIKGLTAAFNFRNITPINFELLLKEFKTRAMTTQNESEVTAAAFNAFLAAAVDPHTRITPTQQNEENMAEPDDRFVGIGIELKKIGKQTIVIAPIEGSPAHKAGIRANDVIVKIGKVNAETLDWDQTLKKIRGPVGTKVKFLIKRKKQFIKIEITRGAVVQENVSYKLVQDTGISFGYIKFRSFMDQSGCQKIAEAITSLEFMGAQGLILDLRGNLGGLLDQSICIGGLFLGIDQIVVRVKDLTNNQEQALRSQNNSITDLPMVVLIDAGSASASEVLAGALQDHKRSWIAGDRSFGKATVQAVVPQPEGITFIGTVQRFYQPSGRTNQVIGITPDFELEPKPNATEEDMFALREADLYTNALPALSNPWEQTRLSDYFYIDDCVQNFGSAKEAFEEKQNDVFPPDYRLLVAQDILACEPVNRRQ